LARETRIGEEKRSKGKRTERGSASSQGEAAKVFVKAIDVESGDTVIDLIAVLKKSLGEEEAVAMIEAKTPMSPQTLLLTSRALLKSAVGLGFKSLVLHSGVYERVAKPSRSSKRTAASIVASGEAGRPRYYYVTGSPEHVVSEPVNEEEEAMLCDSLISLIRDMNERVTEMRTDIAELIGEKASGGT
jgi:hypothetical protein